MERRKKCGSNLGTWNGEANGARDDEMEAQRGARPTRLVLQKTLRPEARHGICNRHCFPLKNPAGHRKAYCRVTQMHQSHITPANRACRLDPLGEETTSLYRHNSNAPSGEQGTSVPSKWHRSNSSNQD